MLILTSSLYQQISGPLKADNNNADDNDGDQNIHIERITATLGLVNAGKKKKGGLFFRPPAQHALS